MDVPHMAVMQPADGDYALTGEWLKECRDQFAHAIAVGHMLC